MCARRSGGYWIGRCCHFSHLIDAGSAGIAS